jgi:hypothetical protein
MGQGGDMLALAIAIFLILTLAVVAYGYYTRRAKTIEQRPTDARGGAPGAQTPSQTTAADPDVESTVSTHGTR